MIAEFTGAVRAGRVQVGRQIRINAARADLTLDRVTGQTREEPSVELRAGALHLVHHPATGNLPGIRATRPERSGLWLLLFAAVHLA